jgi:PTS system nitrogen regulatory IIA component
MASTGDIRLRLTDILSAERVRGSVNVGSKKKVLEELANLLAQGAGVLTPPEVFSSLTAREKLGSTGLGGGVAIPHGRVTGLDESLGALLRLRHPVDFEAQDGEPVDLLFGLLVPEAATDVHLRHLAQLAELFSDRKLREQLRAAPDDRALYVLLSAAAGGG